VAAYEVLLLNTAIPQIQAAQSGDTYVVPRDIAFSAALTLSAGTANGVPYLNASKVVTTGSALSFDGTNLAFGTVGAKINFATTGSATQNYVGLAADGYSLEIVTQRGAIQPLSYKQDFSVGHVWSITNTQAMTLDASGRLLVGTTSAYLSTFKSVVEGATSGSANFALGLFKSGTPEILNGDVLGNIYFYGVDNRIPAGNNNLGAQISCVATTDWTTDGTTSNAALVFYTHGTASGAPPERARITSDGNFFVGTTALLADANYFATSPGNAWSVFGHANGTASGIDYAKFYYNNGQIGSISQNGTTAVAYNTSSDYRLKDNPQPLTNSGAFIDALQPKTWNWKADGSKGVGFIAHEVQEVSPGTVVGDKDAVDADGKPVMQAMEYGSAEFIANIVAELQSLRARVAQLEAK